MDISLFFRSFHFQQNISKIFQNSLVLHTVYPKVSPLGKLTPTFNLTVFIYELYFNDLSRRLIFSQSCHRVFGQGLYHRKLKCFWETNYFFLNPFPNRNTNPFCTYLWKSNERKIDIQFFCLNIFFGPKFS